MKLTKIHRLGLGFALALLTANFILFFAAERKIFLFLIGIVIAIGTFPFLMTVTSEVGREKEKEDMFLEFSRNLVEAVKSGTPISKSIVNVKDKNYGSLSPHILKLANQIALGIPVKEALKIFSDDIGNRVVMRSVALISEAEQAGGQIDTILESVARSVSEIEDIKKEQKASISNLVMQGYIIFVIFIVIMLITELKILPMTVGLAQNQGVGLGGSGGLMGGGGGDVNTEDLSRAFLELLLVQGFFAGLVIGKLSEGSTKAGLKHSFILTILAWIMTTGAEAFFPVTVAAA